MKIKIVLILCLSILIAINSTAAGFDKEAILKDRKEKDVYYKTADDSPLPKEKKKSFKGLKYFEPSKDFCVNAVFSLSPKADTVLMATSKKNDIRKMLCLGKFTFKIKGKEYSLNAYYPTRNNVQSELFIPFSDETNSKTTYAAGRYLDIVYKKGTANYVLDFNLAYNPYCAYNHKYSCPLVPLQNNLSLKVTAGEKKP